MSEWIRPAAILGVVFLLITLNVLEFREKRRRDENEGLLIGREGSPEADLAKKQYQIVQNIEQLLHIINTMLFAILVALLWN